MSDAVRDQNRIAGIIAETYDANRTPSPLSVDPVTGRLRINGTVTGTVIVDNLGTTVIAGQKTVAVTDTAVKLTTSSTPIKNGVIIQALVNNSTTVVVGPSTVTTANGFQLQAGQSTSLAIDDLASVYINGTAGDGVCFISSV